MHAVNNESKKMHETQYVDKHLKSSQTVKEQS